MTSVLVVVFSSAYVLDLAYRLFFSTFFILNLPVWLLVFVWRLAERARVDRWRILVVAALVINYLSGLGVLYVWGHGMAGYFILIVSSFLAGIVLRDLSDTVVYIGVCSIFAAVTSVFMMLSPLLIYGAPPEQINVSVLFYGREILVQLMIFGPTCLFGGIVGCLTADWLFRRYTLPDELFV